MVLIMTISFMNLATGLLWQFHKTFFSVICDIISAQPQVMIQGLAANSVNNAKKAL